MFIKIIAKRGITKVKGYLFTLDGIRKAYADLSSTDHARKVPDLQKLIDEIHRNRLQTWMVHENATDLSLIVTYNFYRDRTDGVTWVPYLNFKHYSYGWRRHWSCPVRILDESNGNLLITIEGSVATVNEEFFSKFV